MVDKIVRSLTESRNMLSAEYELRTEAYLEIFTHYTGQKNLLIKTIERRRPSEDDDTLAYRLDTLESVTTKPLLDALDIAKSTITEYNWSVDGQSERLSIWRDQPIDTPAGQKTFDQYMNNEGFEFSMIDANGWHVFLPESSGEETKTKLKLVYFNSRNVIADNNEHLLAVADFGFWYFNTKEIYQIYQVKIDDKLVWVKRLYYTHNLGMLPGFKNGGYIRTRFKDNKNLSYGFETGLREYEAITYYVSFFHGSVASANEYINKSSDANVIYSLNAHLLRVVHLPDCKPCRGQGKKMYPGRGEDTCDTCSGRGKDFAPLEAVTGMVVLKSMTDSQFVEGGKQLDAIRWLAPPESSINNFIKLESDRRKTYLESLHLSFEEGQGQSGKAKEINRQTRHAFNASVGKRQFENRQTAYNVIEGYLTPQPHRRSQVKVILPHDFTIKTEADLLNTIKELPDNMPLSVKSQMNLDFVNRSFANKPVQLKIENYLAMKLGSLYGADQGDIMDFRAVNQEGDPDVQECLQIYYKGQAWLRQIANEREDFLDLSFDDLDTLVMQNVQTVSPIVSERQASLDENDLSDTERNALMQAFAEN